MPERKKTKAQLIDQLSQLKEEVSKNVSVKKLAVEKLWESEESLRVLMNSNPEAVFLLDTEGNFIAANEMTAKRFGKSIKELIDTNVYSYLNPDIAKKRREKVEEVVQTGKPLRFDDTRNNRYYDNYLHPVFDSEGEVIRIAVWVIEFTERKLAVDALKSSEEKIQKTLEKEKKLSELKSKFISMVSHEFRTPLGLILSSAELLENYGKNWEEAKRKTQFDRIKDAIDNLTGLIQDIITISEEESGVIKLSPKEINLELFINGLIDEVKSSAQKFPGIHLKFSKELLTANADEKQLRNIFLNLISNAVKYTPNGNDVSIFLSTARNKIKFKIKDGGLGIPAKDLENIFEPFIRGKNVKHTKGSGLGLSIVKSAVNLCGGEINVSSKINEGTEFTVILPLIHQQHN